jgi:hypothetical protein
MSLLLLPLLLTLGAAPECTADNQCVMIKPCICQCCPVEQVAAPVAGALAERRRCSRMGSCSGEGCGSTKCAPPEDPTKFEAVCEANKCIRHEKGTPRPGDKKP